MGSRAASLVSVEGVPQEVKDGFAIDGPMTVGGEAPMQQHFGGMVLQ